MRKDGKPLTKEAIETIWMFHDHLLDVFGDEDGAAAARSRMTRAAFDRFCKKYKEEMVLNGHPRFTSMSLPL